MRRKIICLFLCVILLLSVLVFPVFAEASTDPITMADATAVEGELLTYDVPISIEVVEAMGINLNIRLNPGLVETAEMIDPAESISYAMVTSNQNADKFKVAIASGEAITHTGRLFTLRLTLKKEAASEDELCKLLQIKVNERITWQANDRVLLTGVTDGASYKDNVTITFNEGTATLNGEAFVSGGIVTENGEYTLVITDTGKAVRTVRFTIDRTVISVEVEWTEMSFVYDEGVWNDSTHSYDNSGWKSTENGGKLTVTNNSNIDIRSEFSYEANEKFKSIIAQFMNDDETIQACNVAINERVTVSVCLLGKPKEYFEISELGTITVKIAIIKEALEENEYK